MRDVLTAAIIFVIILLAFSKKAFLFLLFLFCFPSLAINLPVTLRSAALAFITEAYKIPAVVAVRFIFPFSQQIAFQIEDHRQSVNCAAD